MWNSELDSDSSCFDYEKRTSISLGKGANTLGTLTNSVSLSKEKKEINVILLTCPHPTTASDTHIQVTLSAQKSLSP